MSLSTTRGQFSNAIHLKLTNTFISKAKQPSLTHPITGRAIMPSMKMAVGFQGKVAKAKNRAKLLRRIKRNAKLTYP